MAHHDGLPYEPDERTRERNDRTRERLERERQDRVHQEAHEPTGDWIELAADPDAKLLDAVTADLIRDRRKQDVYDRGFTAGHAIGKAEGEVELIDGHLVVDGPTDYEVWRDALTLAVTEGMAVDDDGVSSAVVLARAQWFHKQLQQAPAQDVPDEVCPDCQGEDGNHFTGCVVGG